MQSGTVYVISEPDSEAAARLCCYIWIPPENRYGKRYNKGLLLYSK